MGNKRHLSFLAKISSMVLVSLFIALYVVLSFFRIYITNELRISLTFIPIAWASILFGPLAGALTGAFGDILGWAVNPVGPYFPGFTISGFVTGIIYGLFLYKKETNLTRIIAASVLMVLIVEVGLNSVWMSILAGSAYKVLIPVRLVKALVATPIQVLVLHSTAYLVKKYAPAGIHKA